jgi:hypothetical protein
MKTCDVETALDVVVDDDRRAEGVVEFFDDHTT